jgi:hypothetical protein
MMSSYCSKIQTNNNKIFVNNNLSININKNNNNHQPDFIYYYYFKNLNKTKITIFHQKLLLLKRKIHIKWKKDYLHINQSSNKLLEYRLMVS